MSKAYPIIIHAKSGDSHYVEIPDIERGTQGADHAEAMAAARDALCIWAITEQDAGRAIPEPSPLDSVSVPEGAFVTLVDVDFAAYRRTLDTRAVRKNCTIPSWLNEAAEKQGVNFSAVLQQALINQLGIDAPAAR